MSSFTFSSFRCCHSSSSPASPSHSPSHSHLSNLQTKPLDFKSRDNSSREAVEASTSNVAIQPTQLSNVALVTPACRNFLKLPVSFQPTSLLSLVSSCWRFVAPSAFQRNSIHQIFSMLVAVALASNLQGAPSSKDTFENVPQTLSGGDKVQRIQRPKSAKAESCTRKCVSTCIRGGAGAPGEGPLNVRRPLVVFKEGFRSRQYCLIECSAICNLIGDGDDGP